MMGRRKNDYNEDFARELGILGDLAKHWDGAFGRSRKLVSDI